MLTGVNPDAKYGPTGEAITRYSTSWEGRTPMNFSEANMNGRRYSEDPGVEGTHSTSVLTRVSIEARNISSLISGRARRLAEALMRAALASGRKVHTDPSACR